MRSREAYCGKKSSTGGFKGPRASLRAQAPTQRKHMEIASEIRITKSPRKLGHMHAIFDDLFRWAIVAVMVDNS